MSEVFWVGFYTSVIACMLGIIKMMYKSKCSSVDVCCVKITRDTAVELKEDEMELGKREKEGEMKV